MYRIVCESYENFIKDFEPYNTDDYRYKIAKPLKLILDLGLYEDEKYYIEDKNGDKLLLRLSEIRLSEISLYDRKKDEFEHLSHLKKLDINIPNPVDMGICDNGDMRALGRNLTDMSSPGESVQNLQTDKYMGILTTTYLKSSLDLWHYMMQGI